MNERKIVFLADEIAATVKQVVETAFVPVRARITEIGAALASLNVTMTELQARIEQVANEPRVHIEPKFIVPTPTVNVSPVLRLPERKPVKRVLTPNAEGGFTVEDSSEKE